MNTINERERQLIRETVAETIAELKRAGLLRNLSDVAYSEAAEILRAFYREGQTDKAVASALEEMEKDQYYKIIPLTYSYGYTLEELAEFFGADISTITRNKKRLCVEIYQKLN